MGGRLGIETINTQKQTETKERERGGERAFMKVIERKCERGEKERKRPGLLSNQPIEGRGDRKIETGERESDNEKDVEREKSWERDEKDIKRKR